MDNSKDNLNTDRQLLYTLDFYTKQKEYFLTSRHSHYTTYISKREPLKQSKGTTSFLHQIRRHSVNKRHSRNSEMTKIDVLWWMLTERDKCSAIF